MDILIAIILTSFIVGPMTYFFGECNGYQMALDFLGYEWNSEGEVVKKEFISLEVHNDNHK
jgi:hypothetical protein